MVIGLFDCGGGPMGCSDWLSVHSAVVVFPGGVRIGFIRRALTEISSLDAAPVTGSLVFSAPVCYFAIYCAAGFSLWTLLGGIECVWLAGRGLIFRRVSVDWIMATDGAAVVGDQAGITFGVELVIPWDAPKAVVDLQSEGVVDDPGCYWPGWSAAGCCRMSSATRDARSVHVLVPDSRGLDQNIHDVTIVDMGDLPEPSVSLDELSMPEMATGNPPSYGVATAGSGSDARGRQETVSQYPAE